MSGNAGSLEQGVDGHRGGRYPVPNVRRRDEEGGE